MVIGHVLVRCMVMRLMDVLPVRLVVLRRTRVVPWLRMFRRMIIRVRRGRMAVIVARGVSLVMVGAAVMVVVVPVLCIRRSACG